MQYEHYGVTITVDKKDGRFRATMPTGEKINAASLNAARLAIANARAKFKPFYGLVTDVKYDNNTRTYSVKRVRIVRSDTRERFGSVVTEYYTESGYRSRSVYADTPANRAALREWCTIQNKCERDSRRAHSKAARVLRGCALATPEPIPAPKAKPKGPPTAKELIGTGALS